MKAEDLRLLRQEPTANPYFVERSRNSSIEEEFDALAEYLYNRFHPQSVLELGCDSGFLVASLHRRGIRAAGIDRSSQALANAQAEIQPSVRLAAYSEPFLENYDLIVCLQALSGLSSLETEQVIDNLCSGASVVFFCQAPLDPNEPNPQNFLAPADWAGLFASRGYYHDLDDLEDEFSPWCMTFRQIAKDPVQIVQDYERGFTSLRLALRLRRSHAVETHLEITQKEAQLEETMAEIQDQYEQALMAARERVEELQHELDEVYASRAWRFGVSFRRLRLFFFPHGSRQERWLRFISRK